MLNIFFEDITGSNMRMSSTSCNVRTMTWFTQRSMMKFNYKFGPLVRFSTSSHVESMINQSTNNTIYYAQIWSSKLFHLMWRRNTKIWNRVQSIGSLRLHMDRDPDNPTFCVRLIGLYTTS